MITFTNKITYSQITNQIIEQIIHKPVQPNREKSMSKTFEMTGIIHSKGETTTFGNNGFTKREFVLKASGPEENTSYPNYIALELIKDKCSLLDQFSVGDELEVSFNISGRLWQGQGKPEKCFTSLQVWKMSLVQPSNDQPQTNMTITPTNITQPLPGNTARPTPPLDTSSSNDIWDDDIPF